MRKRLTDLGIGQAKGKRQTLTCDLAIGHKAKGKTSTDLAIGQKAKGKNILDLAIGQKAKGKDF